MAQTLKKLGFKKKLQKSKKPIYFVKNGLIRLEIGMDQVCNISQRFTEQIFDFHFFNKLPLDVYPGPALA